MKIGVFDSGVGGLTVLRALLKTMPDAEFIYLGDTARLPYGSKSQATIARYATSSAQFLLEQGAQYLVIACNTASALALPEIRQTAEPFRVPVLGVVETGANAADASSRTRDVLVIATAATVASGAYTEACRERGMRAIEKACPLLVPLVEEGWIEYPVTEQVVDIYLNELLRSAAESHFTPDTLVLGCTHYPLLREVIRRAVPPSIAVIDSAEVTALYCAYGEDASRYCAYGEDASRKTGLDLGLGETQVSEARPGAPGSVAQRPGAPGSVAQRPGVHGSVAQRPGAPGSVAQRPGAPGSVAQRAGALGSVVDSEWTNHAKVRFFATDSVEKFKVLGARFLGMPIEHVELVDLGG